VPRTSATSTDLHRLPDGRTKLSAHDVRRLCACKECNGLADDRDTVREMHPKCFYEKFGESGVLALPSSDRGRFSLSDIPVALMKKLVG
jgi:hypothetical protein